MTPRASYSVLVPEDYQGNIAVVSDTCRKCTSADREFFHLKAIDDQRVRNIGTNFWLYRDVQAKKQFAFISAEKNNFGSQFVTPLYPHPSVEGVVEFDPKPDEHYLVNGEFTDKHSAVWIENLAGEIVTEKVIKLDIMTINQGELLKNSNYDKIKQSRSRLEWFVNISYRESEKLVLEKLGKPDREELEETSFFANFDYANYHYKDLGVIRFLIRPDGLRFVHRVNPDFEKIFEKPEETRILFETANSPNLLRWLRNRFINVNNIKDPETLDIISSLILRNKHTTEEFMVDALSKLCELVGLAGNSTYENVLKEVADSAEEEKLRSSAVKGLGLLNPPSV